MLPFVGFGEEEEGKVGKGRIPPASFGEACEPTEIGFGEKTIAPPTTAPPPPGSFGDAMGTVASVGRARGGAGALATSVNIDVEK